MRETINHEVIAEEVKETTVPEVTHNAYSMLENADGTFSAVKIGFNPKALYVSPMIEILETNTDKFIIQERVSILLLEMEMA